MQKIARPAEIASSPDNKAISTNIQNTSAKGDKLEASYTVEGSADPISVKPDLVAPAETEPKRPDKTKIVSRHWHDPLDKRDAQAAQASVKRKLANNASTARRHVVSAGAPKP
ncbi:hypothetical protein [Bradyrhizobium sp. Ash2021]|uniref:hypothetical protein n=1 Tax=Bradyrhizobium sp. Ash2021 TaxID=2954771 RepID=UPI002814C8BC|nr:hypothetical protein [Bradyrhizobium sp. Ash2021]WMT75895.1 hypothetical protein NL528_05670 [Bradyrhizobium sp. Ash2021]